MNPEPVNAYEKKVVRGPVAETLFGDLKQNRILCQHPPGSVKDPLFCPSFPIGFQLKEGQMADMVRELWTEVRKWFLQFKNAISSWMPIGC